LFLSNVHNGVDTAVSVSGMSQNQTQKAAMKRGKQNLPKDGSYKTFLNGNLPMYLFLTLYTFVLHKSIELTGYYKHKQRWHWFTFLIKSKNNVIKYIYMKNRFTKYKFRSKMFVASAFVVDTK